MKQACATCSGSRPASPRFAAMYAWAWSSSSARDRGCAGGADASRSTYRRRTRSMTCSARSASSREIVLSASPAAAPQKNCAASRGRPRSPGILIAVRRESCEACLPRVAFGSFRTSRSNGSGAGRWPAARCHSRSCRRASAPPSGAAARLRAGPAAAPRGAALGVAGGDVGRRAAHRVGLRSDPVEADAGQPIAPHARRESVGLVALNLERVVDVDDDCAQNSTRWGGATTQVSMSNVIAQADR